MASAASCTKSTTINTKQVVLCSGPKNQPGAKWAEFTYVYANTYATGGGDPCDLTGTFPNNIITVVLPPIDDTGVAIQRFAKSAKKMLAYKAGSGAAAPAEYAGVDLSAATFKFQVLGN